MNNSLLEKLFSFAVGAIFCVAVFSTLKPPQQIDEKYLITVKTGVTGTVMVYSDYLFQKGDTLIIEHIYPPKSVK